MEKKTPSDSCREAQVGQSVIDVMIADAEMKDKPSWKSLFAIWKKTGFAFTPLENAQEELYQWQKIGWRKYWANLYDAVQF